MPARKPAAAPAKPLPPLDRWTLREHLRGFSGNGTGKRLVDYFREMDDDGSGELTQKEFGKALKRLGFVDATKEQIDAVWKDFDVSRL